MAGMKLGAKAFDFRTERGCMLRHNLLLSMVLAVSFGAICSAEENAAPAWMVGSKVIKSATGIADQPSGNPEVVATTQPENANHMTILAREKVPTVMPGVANGSEGKSTIFQTGIRMELVKPETSLLERMIDYRKLSLGTAEANVLYIYAPTRVVQPFWSVARETPNPRDDSSRLGFGTGVQLNISPNASIGAETLLFSRDRQNSDMDRSSPLNSLGDAQFFTRLQIKF